MNIFGFNITRNKKEEVSSAVYQDNLVYGKNYTPVARVWDGEKTLGELGIPIKNVPDYNVLRIRSYDAYTKSDVVRVISSKFFYWVVGSGLKLQSEPNKVVLESEGISFDSTNFQRLVEARFMVYAKSKECSFSKDKSLHELAMDAFQGKFLGGDMLCVLRFDDNGPNLQVISGEHIKNPGVDSDFHEKAKTRGNRIEYGIEIDPKGNHVAYYVCSMKKDELTSVFERIEAKGEKSKKTMAWMVSGNKISPDHIRAVPAISQSLEKIAKLDRYTEAAVGKAEQAAKIFNYIEHDKSSTGEDIYRSTVALKRGEPTMQLGDATVLGDGLANRITETTSNQTFNMPIGSTMKSFHTDIESDFGVFHGNVFNIISAGLDVPPEVAMQMYNSNYSASRAAINAWGYVVDIHREKTANEFYVPFFRAWLEFEILRNKIDAPEYIASVRNKNIMVTESYAQCRFTGKNMPHIDPLKEIKAIREALGVDDTSALISREQATEQLGYGQWDENFSKNLEEKKKIPVEQIEPKKIDKNGQESKA